MSSIKFSVKGNEASNMTGDHPDRSVVDSLGIAILSMYSLTILSAPVFSTRFGGYLPEDAGFLTAIIITSVIGALVLTTAFRHHVIHFTDKATTDDRSVWNEVVLYTLTYIPVTIISGLLISLLTAAWSATPDTVLLLHHALATGLTVVLLFFRRKGQIEYPHWIQVHSWGARDYVALFGGTFLLTYAYMTSAFGPTSALLVPFSLFCATVLVVLRWAGAFTSTNNPGSPQTVAGD